MSDLGKFDRFKVPLEGVEQLLKAKRVAKRIVSPRRSKQRFVKGPIQHSTLARAYRAHRAGLPVLLAAKTAVDMARSRTGAATPVIALTDGVCAEIGVSPDARIEAIKALAVAGLLDVTWFKKRAPRVSIPVGVF